MHCVRSTCLVASGHLRCSIRWRSNMPLRGSSPHWAWRRNLCPLDLADDLPELIFGNATVRQYNTAELSMLFDEARLANL